MIDTPDIQVRRQVEEALEADKRTRGAVIEVSCLAGRVSLAGTVAKAAMKMAAEEVARAVPGVAVVINELRVH